MNDKHTTAYFAAVNAGNKAARARLCAEAAEENSRAYMRTCYNGFKKHAAMNVRAARGYAADALQLAIDASEIVFDMITQADAEAAEAEQHARAARAAAAEAEQHAERAARAAEAAQIVEH